MCESEGNFSVFLQDYLQYSHNHYIRGHYSSVKNVGNYMIFSFFFSHFPYHTERAQHITHVLSRTVVFARALEKSQSTKLKDKYTYSVLSVRESDREKV